MTRILRIGAAPFPTDDGGWASRALRAGHAVEAVRAFMGYGEGAGLRDAQLPRRLRPLRHPVPDLFATRAGLLVASEAAREVIEAHDPGLHRFWPVDVGAPHHGLIVRATGAAITERGSLCHVEPALPRLGLPRHVTLLAHAARVDAARLPAANLWWDRALSRPYLLVSDCLAFALEALDAIPMRCCDA
ncbi:hypothetical protein [Jannaschia sp. W003]|uniref:hypothetical protein n=1 Tax=Jannaschia sp. W003 TaxID=2867012 RepID=UPI0021A2F114|nr:hypothetical protein [Jannaschia sp. W003]UWQ20728.1 hypothetical protein K3554_12170 [Jannaschia sp. W003]